MFDSKEDNLNFRDIDRGWAWIVLIACFFSFCILGNAQFSVGIMHAALLEKHGASLAVTSWAGALHVALVSLAAPLSTLLLNRFNCRLAMVISSLLYALGYILTAFSPHIIVSIISCGIIAGTAGGIGYTATIVAINFSFRKHRNLATGIAHIGIGLGSSAFAPLMEIARSYYGTSGFFFIVAGMNLHMAVCGMACFPSQLEKHIQITRRVDALKNDYATSSCLSNVCQPYATIIRNRYVWLLSISLFSYCLGIYLVGLHLPSFIASKGFSAIQAASLISLMGFFSAFGRLTAGVLGNMEFVNDMTVYAVPPLILSVVIFTYPLFSNALAGHIAFAVIFGLLFGSLFVMYQSVNVHYVGIKNLSVALGVEFMVCGIGGIIGPVLAGLLIDMGGSYELSLQLAGVFILLASITGLLTLCFKPTKTPNVICSIDDAELSMKTNE
ncbi:monocarboxylate transporter 13-like [Mya arenaria]|uniref:monocarboxylate transporter 13-like n=1 Tax=Mya arenaria TaxID=6604 RepID=UPI0022E7BB50|nr:monocarboxylate transporter 13-like [Mya arenaria]